MKAIRHAIAIALLAALATLPAVAQVRDYKKIKYPALPEFEIPSPEVYTLDNGMTVFLMEDHELPLISVSTRIRTGSLYEPASKTGLGAIMGQVQREGGTRNMTGDQIDDYLADRAASIETGVGDTSGFASMNCLADDFDEVFAVFNDVLRSPVFDEDKIEVAKAQFNSGIARRNDDVGQITGREFSRLIYGKGSPISRMMEYQTIDAVTRDDLVAWHSRYYHPNNVMIGVVGDFDSAEMKSKIAATFGDWARGPDADLPAVPYDKEMKAGVYFIPKEDVTQANIRMGHVGISTKNPDFFAVQVMNEVLGGGFASRLFSNVRSKKGLAYSVFGGVGSSFDYPGIAQVGLQTKSETMGEAVDALREEMVGIIENPPSDEELQRAKDSILNSFVFNYASRRQVLNQQMAYAYHGMPLDFLETYRANIEKVSRDDVAAVAKKYVHPDKAVLLVVGKAADFDRPVSSFGQVNEIDISIPPPPDKAPTIEKTAASLEQGANLFARATSVIGGERAPKTKALRTAGSISMNVGGQQMGLTQSSLIVFPDKLRIVIGTPMGEQTIVLAGDRGFMMAGGQTRDLPPQMIADQLADLGRDLQYLTRYRDDAGIEAVAGGMETVDGVECQVVEVSYKGAESRLWIDADGLVRRQSYQDKHPMTQAPGTFDVYFSDFRDVDGWKIAHNQKIQFNGEDFATVTTSKVEIDPEVDPAAFEKPGA